MTKEYEDWLKSSDGLDYQGKLPKITAYMNVNNQGRRRSFRIGEFTIMVEPHEDDAAQEKFTRELAEVASRPAVTGCSHPFCECECHEVSS